MGFRWITRPSQVWPTAAQAHTRAIRRGVLAIARRRSPEITAWMQANAPWTDRTAAARQTLHTEVEELAVGMVEVIMSHGVSYGQYLELAMGGRWQILGHALDTWGVIIWQDVQDLLRR